MSQQPSVGRIVHYRSWGTPFREDGTQAFPPMCRAAIITAVDPRPEDNPDQVFASLCVLNPTGQFFNENVIQDEEHKLGGSWHWPERVEQVADGG